LRSAFPRLQWLLDRGVLCILLFIVLALWIDSWTWQPVHDQVLMSYVALLHDAFGKVPYRDVFEMNPPGTHLLSRLVFGLVGRSAQGLRLLDLAWLLATAAFTVATLRPFGWRVGVSAACLFGIDYLGLGPLHAFQREYLCVLPIAVSLWLALRAPGSAATRSLGIGLLFGVVATIKPFLAFGIVPVGGFVLAEIWTQPTSAHRSRARQIQKSLLCAALGGILPIAVCLGVLQQQGALASFLSMVREYWPLYAELRGDGSLRGSALDGSLIDGVRSVVNTSTLLFMAPVGVLAMQPCFADARARREILAFVGLALVFALYIAMAGKFWEYHGLPLFYACALFGGFVEYRRKGETPRIAWVALRSLTLACLVWLSLAEAPHQQAARAWHARVTDQAQAVARFLSRHAQPGEAIQPLDVANGAVHAMWLVEADLATSLLYDFHLYHHADSPYIRGLQSRLLRELEASKPRFIIAATQPAFRARGPGSTTFPELAELVSRDYVRVYRSGGLEVLERRAAAR
jgi:hypothetical protein